MKKDSKALTCRQDICDFLGIGKDKFYSFLKDGLPVKKAGGSWIGHKDELNAWFLVNENLKITLKKPT